MIKRLCLLILLSANLQACWLKPWVKPYERENLADPIMAFDSNPLDAGFVNHTYESREGARGAQGGGGGGCGCN